MPGLSNKAAPYCEIGGPSKYASSIFIGRSFYAAAASGPKTTVKTSRETDIIWDFSKLYGARDRNIGTMQHTEG